jgi:hypothetical protein
MESPGGSRILPPPGSELLKVVCDNFADSIMEGREQHHDGSL